MTLLHIENMGMENKVAVAEVLATVRRIEKQITVQPLNLVFDGPPSGDAGATFIEAELDDGSSVVAGQWHEVDEETGQWILRIEQLPLADGSAHEVINPYQVIDRVTELFEKWAGEIEEHRAAGFIELASALEDALNDLRQAVHS